ncbi:hypothetical protein H310_14495 [Aphanomyces invadans]|uniref:DUF7769 domain-containing protein n=1 Tax=Aphanomyces invadans TaxID=157072 RepID=A0A024TBM1_9STRA|nr:hypothetical protein H310_14495 [Aphanomyces invadans]ETV90757.1 hypothetical protein H310_14495 [Aphanomyces invadans]|eukprot:XP_008880593.1 hypothetical protein H310_14495 [Aphanomyces invadans]
MTTKPRLTDAQRTEVYVRLSLLKSNGRIKQGGLKPLCDEFGVTKMTLSKIWRRACETKAATGVAVVNSLIKSNSGRRANRDLANVRAQVTAVHA